MKKSKTILESTDPADASYLKKAGWTIVDDMWRDPRHKGREGRGDYGNPESAARRQREYDRFDKGLPIYAVCSARDGYGYLLRRWTGADKPWTTVARHADEGLLDGAANLWNTIEDAEKLAVNEQVMADFRDHYAYPYLLLLEEKHGTFRYHVPTREQFHKACLYTVQRRNEDGCWYDYDTEPAIEPTLSKEQVAAMKPGRLREAAEQEWTDYEATLHRIKGEEKERALLAKALKGDGEAAADFLRARKGHQYEDFEIVELDSIDES